MKSTGRKQLMGVTLPSKSAQLVWGCNIQRSFRPAPSGPWAEGLELTDGARRRQEALCSRFFSRHRLKRLKIQGKLWSCVP